MSTTLTRDGTGRVARVTFDNAARGNCFDLDLLEDLVGSLEVAAADSACAVIRLDLAGRHFCGGWDTRSFAGMAGAEEESIVASLRASDALLDRIRRLPIPVVAGVRGHVIGFGVGLLAAIHLPVVTDDAIVSLPEVKFGFAPAGVGHTVAQAVPRAQAYGLLTGTLTASGDQLARWGLAVMAVASDGLDDAVAGLVDGIAALPAAAVRGVVEVVESSLSTGRAAHAHTVSARTIIAALADGASR